MAQLRHWRTILHHCERMKQHACVRALEDKIAQTPVSSRSHRYDVQEAQEDDSHPSTWARKEMSHLKEGDHVRRLLGNYYTAGGGGGGAGFCNFQVVLNAGPCCLPSQYIEKFSIRLAIWSQSRQNPRAKTYTDIEAFKVIFLSDGVSLCRRRRKNRLDDEFTDHCALLLCGQSSHLAGDGTGPPNPPAPVQLPFPTSGLRLRLGVPHKNAPKLHFYSIHL